MLLWILEPFGNIKGGLEFKRVGLTLNIRCFYVIIMSNETEDLRFAVGKVEPVVLDYLVPFELFSEKNEDSNFEDITDDIMDIMKKFATWIDPHIRDVFIDDEKYQDFSLVDYLDTRLAEDQYYIHESTEYPRYIITLLDKITNHFNGETIDLGKTVPFVDIYWGKLGPEKLRYCPQLSPKEHIEEAWDDLGESLVKGVSILRYDISQGVDTLHRFGGVATRLRDLNEFDRACRKATSDEEGIFEMYPLLLHSIDVKRLNEIRPRFYYLNPEAL